MRSSLERSGRLDLHLHSYASNQTTYYAANAFSIPESYSDPLKLYSLLKSRGMSLVTLSDHNTIDGAKLLRDKGYEDVFYSAEMTARFPEDGCHIHVIVANVSEAQFDEVQRLRANVYEMVSYLDAEIARDAHVADRHQIAYFMAHPLMSTEKPSARTRRRSHPPSHRKSAVAVRRLRNTERLARAGAERVDHGDARRSRCVPRR